MSDLQEDSSLKNLKHEERSSSLQEHEERSSSLQENTIVSGAAAEATITLVWPRQGAHQRYQVNAQLDNICRWIRQNTSAAVSSCSARRAEDVKTDEF